MPADPVRVHPEGKQCLQQLRGETWIDVVACLCPEPDGIPALRFFAEGEPPPEGAQLVEQPVELLESLLAQAKARQTLEHAQLSAAEELALRLLCLLEEDDRRRWLVVNALPYLWKNLHGAGLLGDADALIDRLIGGGVVTGGEHGGPGQRLEVPPPIEREVCQALPPELTHHIFEFVGTVWAQKFVSEQAQPTRSTVRAGIGASVYMMRLGHWEMAFNVLEREVLPVARRTGEAAPVLHHLANYANWSGLPQLAERLEKCQREAMTDDSS